nr:MarR family transcriptional regulator [uncultured Pseudodesulfovibrio sp.]
MNNQLSRNQAIEARASTSVVQNVYLLYIFSMTTKEETIVHISGRLKRIIRQHMRIEKLPIHIGESCVLRPGEVHFVQAIGRNPGINIHELGGVMGVTRSASSQMVGKLVKKGFAEKRSTPENRKEARVYLTSAGEEAFSVHEDIHERHFKELLHRLDEFSDTQIATAAAVLSVFEGIMDERMEELFGKE